ncbi:MAG: VTT domain-containing protein [Patescibacteria group bacterium]|nr:VTT domain-containing protein [Patescibacteria group bacterium]
MFTFLSKLKIRLYDWAIARAGSPRATQWLSALSFSEASFFPIPPDILLIAILVFRQTRKWAYYAFITTIWSVLGGMLGYFIGFLFFDTAGKFLIDLYHLEQHVLTIKELFNDNAFLAIFMAGFTPIPYKIFTISAGFFGVNFIVFVAASLLSRGMRFFAVGYIMKVFGKEIGVFVFKYFNILTLITAALIILVLLFINIS